MDDVSTSWITDWTLLELFLVLITALIIYRMWGPAWGAAALLTLALIYPETGATRGIWLALLVGEALDRVLPKGRGTWVIHACRLAVAALLVVMAIPFMVDQIRTAIYPDLESQRTLTFPLSSGSPVPDIESSIVSNETPKALDEERRDMAAPAAVPMSLGKMEGVGTGAAGGAGFVPENAIGSHVGASAALGGSVAVSKYSYAAADPNAIITTGPGLPRWQWRTVSLSWRGPVQRGQQIRLWLLSPLVNLMLGFLRVGLIALLAYRALISMRAISRPTLSAPEAAAALVTLIIFAPLLAASAHADIRPTPFSTSCSAGCSLTWTVRRRAMAFDAENWTVDRIKGAGCSAVDRGLAARSGADVARRTARNSRGLSGCRTIPGQDPPVATVAR